jgi:DNA-binding response OmpR family regulator
MGEVMLIRWPEESDDGVRLAGEGVAVLYLVSGDAEPPAPRGCLEDWIRIPGDDRDMSARVAALRLRADAHRAPPRVDDDGRVHYRGRVLALTDEEAGLARLLTARFGALVPDGELVASAAITSAVLRSRMTRLRARLRSVDLVLHRVRRKGYSLQHP